MLQNRLRRLLLASAMAAMSLLGQATERFNFNAEWKMRVGSDAPTEQNAMKPAYDDAAWQRVTLPYAFNGKEAFARAIDDLTDTVVWYRKTFRLPQEAPAKKVFVEFEGVRHAARVYINGHYVGKSENGVMAFGFDLTPHINKTGDNVMAVRVDNNWKYREEATGSQYQWNNTNFYCTYGGINKNVWLHMADDVYQTLPLYSSLGTTGVYVYATNHDVDGHSATVNVESQLRNESGQTCRAQIEVEILTRDGRRKALYTGPEQEVAAGATATCHASRKVDGLEFWSWGYGYLYDVVSRVKVDGVVRDASTIRTGFRKTEFADGLIRLNGRAITMKGFAQRSTNEWPAVGCSHPAWMSDYSNALVLGCNGNMFRWMHVTPAKQDIMSFDRLGLIEAMPAGDAERDVNDHRWEQRKELMRDAIVYNRNNPSILFYEGGNAAISDEHMAEMAALKQEFDPNGGRAMGCRNMNSSHVAEYGGEMLYINTSAYKPMWQMEYCRDEGIRRYWDRWSYPYHIEGDGPLHKGARAVSYNHNQDGLAVENVVRWNEYWLARPGQGKRVNAGGAKIIFSDSNTHFRGEKNYRTSGDVDAMRIAKDSYYAHRVMWAGWVDTEQHGTHIVGHWNYADTVVKPVYVVSTGSDVELLLNGKSLGHGARSETFLFTFADVRWQAGTLTAVSRDEAGRELSRHQLTTTGRATQLRARWIEAPETFRADGADIRIAEIEAVDNDGRRHPLAHDMITFSTSGPAEWLGGVSGYTDDAPDNRVLATELRLEAGVCRVMIRSTTKAGKIKLTATAKGLKKTQLTTTTTHTPTAYGFYVDKKGKAMEADWAAALPPYLAKGPTPKGESFRQRFNTVEIENIEVAVNAEKSTNQNDDDELTEWESDGLLEHAWATYTLQREATIHHVVVRLANFRSTSYPLQVIDAQGNVVWEGYTPKSLGYCYLTLKQPTKTNRLTIRMVGAATVKDAFGDMAELAAKNRISTKESKENKLRILEVAFNESAE